MTAPSTALSDLQAADTTDSKITPRVGPKFVQTRRPTREHGTPTLPGPKFMQKQTPSVAKSGDHTHRRDHHGRLHGCPSANPAAGGLWATKAFALAFSEALWAETRGRRVRIVALCPGPTATGFFSGLSDERATSSILFRHTADPVSVVRAGLRGFDHGAMTVIPGLRNRFISQAHRFLPRAVMARMSRQMLSPS
jgi:NAD(P)-dependent dehydrogenase (short-subunit alcohol dehydrogenase family)